MKKGIYLDIDMDYFVSPIERVSVDNIRLYRDKPCKLQPAEPVIEQLRQRGLHWELKDLHCFTNHKKSYTYWWISKKQNNTVIHIDAHSDLYRNSSRDLRLLPNGELGCYNYLWYAVRDGYADEIYWVLPADENHMVSADSAGKIVNNALLQDCSADEQGLHITMECVDIRGARRSIRLHVCEIGQLPVFNTSCDIVTAATSPEFIPEAADVFIYELFDCLGADRSISDNIFRQHKALLEVSQAELEAARKRVSAE